MSNRLLTILLLSLVLMVATTAIAQDQYPPSGYGVISTTALVQLFDPADSNVIMEGLWMEGDAVIWRSDPYDVGGVLTIDTRMDTLMLRGYSYARAESVFVTLNNDYITTGEIFQVTPGVDFPAESFFDVMYRITFGSEAYIRRSGGAQPNIDVRFPNGIEYTPGGLHGDVELTELDPRPVPEMRLEVSEEQRIDVPVLDLSDMADRDCYYIDYSGGAAAFFWKLPHSTYDMPERGGRITPIAGECCTLMTVYVGIYPDAMAGTPDMQVNVFADDGLGLPGTLLATQVVPYSSLPTSFGYATVDMTAHNLIFCDQDFHIGVESIGGAGDTLVILSDDGIVNSSDRGWVKWDGLYYTNLDSYGEGYNYLIGVDLCCGLPAEPGECDTLSYYCNASYVWSVPSVYGDSSYAQRFTPSGICTLKAVSIAFYEPNSNSQSGEGVDIVIWSDDGSGLPGTILRTVDVPEPGILWFPMLTTVTITPPLDCLR